MNNEVAFRYFTATLGGKVCGTIIMATKRRNAYFDVGLSFCPNTKTQKFNGKPISFQKKKLRGIAQKRLEGAAKELCFSFAVSDATTIGEQLIEYYRETWRPFILRKHYGENWLVQRYVKKEGKEKENNIGAPQWALSTDTELRLRKGDIG